MSESGIYLANIWARQLHSLLVHEIMRSDINLAFVNILVNIQQLQCYHFAGYLMQKYIAYRMKKPIKVC